MVSVYISLVFDMYEVLLFLNNHKRTADLIIGTDDCLQSYSKEMVL